MGFNMSGAKNTGLLEEAGRRVKIINIETGKPFMDGDKPCTALVAGSFSRRFKEAQRIAAAKEEELGDSITDEQKETIRRDMWAAVIIEWDLHIDGDPAVSQIFAMRPEIYDQMVRDSTEHAGFFGDPSLN